MKKNKLLVVIIVVCLVSCLPVYAEKCVPLYRQYLVELQSTSVEETSRYLIYRRGKTKPGIYRSITKDLDLGLSWDTVFGKACNGVALNLPLQIDNPEFGIFVITYTCAGTFTNKRTGSGTCTGNFNEQFGTNVVDEGSFTIKVVK